jgi:hypothetical protein
VAVERRVSRTIRLDPEDARALERAKADGLSVSDLVRQGLRIVAAHYYRPRRRRPPRFGVFVSTDPELARNRSSIGTLSTEP